jgi:DNA polymerase sigma
VRVHSAHVLCMHALRVRAHDTHAHSDVDVRFRQLGVLVKQWARRRGINSTYRCVLCVCADCVGSIVCVRSVVCVVFWLCCRVLTGDHSGTLSSYAYLLMTIVFLQVCMAVLCCDRECVMW